MILITGASGQLGDALVKLCRERGIEFTAVARPEFDFEKPESISACFAAAKPDLVINAAAYTAVDKAEADQEAAKAGNHTGPLALAQLCAAADVPFIHVSTDYVFDGDKGAPYVETDPTGPTGVYGATKRDGEEAILATNAKAVILRTAWVYSAHGKNFARTMLNAGRKMPLLRVVADQRGTPTAAPDLAAAILAIAAKIRATGWQPEYRGIFHATGAGETTWHGFACAIFAEAAKHGYKAPEVQAIATADWPTPTRRPPDSRLDCAKLTQVFGVSLPDWQVTLPGIIDTLLVLDAS
ncbi:dTDP-4-dehydrorhamnose reductase [Acidocella aromatica]|uniref:dTDP-4-dehydrorhamnose reductase n=1 Tax=Acidocella aromatica TaxID=1303579 RepID=A0A840VBZ7_9PROT|nr:dTDP-4-dehydrorhamnose reductase [Acidocella aromatica]MBB5373303.1 dTDP-4-dehydrorhamnose reductase [Acidocella aromatica]